MKRTISIGIGVCILLLSACSTPSSSVSPTSTQEPAILPLSTPGPYHVGILRNITFEDPSRNSLKVTITIWYPATDRHQRTVPRRRRAGARQPFGAAARRAGAGARHRTGGVARRQRCFAGAAPALGYAGFTSTHCTLHPPIAGRDLDARAAALATYYWRLLGAAHALDAGAPQRHPLLRGGRIPVAPDPDRSIRDALIRWGDPATAALLAGLAADAGPPLARFVALFGQPPGEAFAAPGFHAYSCRPRVVDATMLFELRCFHSGLPLADLAPLLDGAATLPDG